jgi:hypothetical protein
MVHDEAEYAKFASELIAPKMQGAKDESALQIAANGLPRDPAVPNPREELP